MTLHEHFPSLSGPDLFSDSKRGIKERKVSRSETSRFVFKEIQWTPHTHFPHPKKP